jgi:hypothetical protein
MTEFQHWLRQLLEKKSKGMDKNGPEYLHLCLVASVCLRPSADLRRSFITMVEKRRGSLAEAKDLQQMRQEQNA